MKTNLFRALVIGFFALFANDATSQEPQKEIQTYTIPMRIAGTPPALRPGDRVDIYRTYSPPTSSSLYRRGTDRITKLMFNQAEIERVEVQAVAGQAAGEVTGLVTFSAMSVALLPEEFEDQYTVILSDCCRP